VEKLSREDWMVGLGGLLLFIGLLAFPWYSVSVTFDGFSRTGTATATDAPYSIWGVFALILMIIVVLDLAIARFSPATAIPTTQFGRDWTRVGLIAVAALFLFIKFLDDVGNFGWGFYIDVVLLVLVLTGAVLTAQGRATPMTVPTGGTR